MRLSDLQNKTMINIKDGKEIGNIIDLNISDNGQITSIVVEKHKFLISHFSSSGEVEIRWEDISKIGEDVILVNIVN